mmetsp:Transcript_76851/g.152405  ORF Transcript_76851/g.152405 Transcript_76851/m.152405 type:complete len:306 (+) Transcript_76851:409-1326(+)
MTPPPCVPSRHPIRSQAVPSGWGRKPIAAGKPIACQLCSPSKRELLLKSSTGDSSSHLISRAPRVDLTRSQPISRVPPHEAHLTHDVGSMMDSEPLGEGEAAVDDGRPESTLRVGEEGSASDCQHGDAAVDQLRIRCKACPPHLVPDGPILDLHVLLSKLYQVVDHSQGDWPSLVNIALRTLNGLRQRIHDRTCEVIDEIGLEAQSRDPLPPRDTTLVSKLGVLHVDLLERFDVFGHERNGDCHHLGDALGAELSYHVVGVRPEPLNGADARLVGEGVVVAVAQITQPRHHERDRRLRLRLVRVS